MEDILGFSYSGLTEEDLRGLSTQSEWAAKLGVDARTIRNWQRDIIGGGEKILSAYYWWGRTTDTGESRKKLDFYQKTLLFLICTLKKGGRTDEEVRQWFLETTTFKGEEKKRIHIVNRNRMRQALGLQ